MSQVSVIMAAHNAELTIEAAIRSVQQQTLTDWELIVVDDGSTDSTAELVRHLTHGDARVRLISLDAVGGSGAARNRAISEAASPFVAVHDADDLAIEDRLQTQVAYLRENRVVAVASQVAEFGEWGGPVVSTWPTSEEAIDRRQRKRKMPLPHPSCTFVRSEVMRVDGYDEACRRAQDYALMLRLGRRPMACLPDVHMLYRTHRPVTLSYVVASGRGGALASLRNPPSRGRDDLSLGNVRQALTDARSVASWSARYVREVRASRGRTSRQ